MRTGKEEKLGDWVAFPVPPAGVGGCGCLAMEEGLTARASSHGVGHETPAAVRPALRPRARDMRLRFPTRQIVADAGPSQL